MANIWQLLTGSLKLGMSHRFDTQFDPRKLQQDLTAIRNKYPPVQKGGEGSDGKWTAISLRSIGGDVAEEQDRNRFETALPYADTSALADAPYLRKVLAIIPGEKDRVRILGLAPGGQINWHSDGPNASVSFGKTIRLHVPILTDPLVDFEISHERQAWCPGELWYGDLSFPHRLHNRSETTRYHLVVDVHVNPPLLEKMAEFQIQKERRTTRFLSLVAATAMLRLQKVVRSGP